MRTPGYAFRIQALPVLPTINDMERLSHCDARCCRREPLVTAPITLNAVTNWCRYVVLSFCHAILAALRQPFTVEHCYYTTHMFEHYLWWYVEHAATHILPRDAVQAYINTCVVDALPFM